MERRLTEADLDALGIQPIVVASHPRSGTHMTIDLLRRQFAACDSWKWPVEPATRLYLNLESLFRLDESRISERQAISLLRRCQRPIIKTHELLDEIPVGDTTRPGKLGRCWLDWLEKRATWIYVCRDGRDVLCSFYLFYQGFKHALPVDIHCFLRQARGGISRPRRWRNHVSHWTKRKGVNLLKFESLIQEPEVTTNRLASILGLDPRWRRPILPPRTPTVWAGRVDRIFRTRPASTAVIGRFGRKKPPRWRTAFTACDHEFFNEEAGEMLVRLGYELAGQ